MRLPELLFIMPFVWNLRFLATFAALSSFSVVLAAGSSCFLCESHADLDDRSAYLGVSLFEGNARVTGNLFNDGSTKDLTGSASWTSSERM